MGKVFGTHDMFFAAQLYAGFFDFGQHFWCICTIAFTDSMRRNPATNSARTYYYLTRLMNRFVLNIVEQFGEKQDHYSLHALRATMFSMQRVFFYHCNLTSSYRANGFTNIPEKITNDKNLARSLNLSSSNMLQSIQFIFVSFLSHPSMVTCRETILFVEVVVCLEHNLDAL